MQVGSIVPLPRAALLAAGLFVFALSTIALVSDRGSLTQSESPPPRAPTDAARLSTQARELREGRSLDLNRATVEELRLLPGIGPKLAGRIVDARTRLGRFSSLRDLDAVPGIGSKKLAQITPLIAIGPTTQIGNNQPIDNVNAK